ncbi:MAG: hypothetical protein R2713_20030 [Ilumatobacteraceae bacterium]
MNVPLDELRERLPELGDAPLVVYCQVGQRGHTATSMLHGGPSGPQPRRRLPHLARLDGGTAPHPAGGVTRWRRCTASRQPPRCGASPI